MFGMESYSKDYIDECRARVDRDLRAFKTVVSAARGSGSGKPLPESAANDHGHRSRPSSLRSRASTFEQSALLAQSTSTADSASNAGSVPLAGCAGTSDVRGGRVRAVFMHSTLRKRAPTYKGCNGNTFVLIPPPTGVGLFLPGHITRAGGQVSGAHDEGPVSDHRALVLGRPHGGARRESTVV